MKKLLLVIVGLLSVTILFAQNLSTQQIIEKMLESIYKVKTASFTQRSWERFKDKTIYAEDFQKINVSPLKFYDYNLKPNKGIEVLFDAEKNAKSANVNPNGFPWTNLSLDPNGSLMHKDQHHALYDAGFSFLANIIKNAYTKALGLGFENIFSLQKDTIYEGHTCYVVKIAAPNYRNIDYTVKANETLITIAHKNMLNEYQILIQNPSLSDYDDVNAGDVIKIPSAYAKITYLIIDTTSFIPWAQKMYDDKGLFERYEYTNLKLNPSFSPTEFTEDFDGYHF